MNSLALDDTLAPPEWMLKSAFGRSSGLVYEQLREEFERQRGVYSKAEFWLEVATHIKCRL